MPQFAACTSWFAWSAPAPAWSQPIYYDYGPGGNVVYENNLVYVNGEEVGIAEDFAQLIVDSDTLVLLVLLRMVHCRVLSRGHPDG